MLLAPAESAGDAAARATARRRSIDEALAEDPGCPAIVGLLGRARAADVDDLAMLDAEVDARAS